jgi:hypothetical protein
LVHARLVADLPVIELGAASDSCPATSINGKLAHPDDHMVVEANPDLIPMLETNGRLNGCGYQIRSAALAYGSEQTRRRSIRGRRAESVGVDTAGPGGLNHTGEAPAGERFCATPTLWWTMEGAKTELEEGALLREWVRTLILETHPSVTGPDRADRMIAAIRALGLPSPPGLRQVFAFDDLTLAP